MTPIVKLFEGVVLLDAEGGIVGNVTEQVAQGLPTKKKTLFSSAKQGFSLTRNQMPRNRLRVRIPCPPF